MIELSYTFGSKRYRISRDSIIAAMKTFDRQHHKSLARTGTKYFVWWRGKAYPPKAILRGLKHGPTGKFSGGVTTNQVFADLEFYVGKGKFPERLRGSNVELPSLTSLKNVCSATGGQSYNTISWQERTGSIPEFTYLHFLGST